MRNFVSCEKIYDKRRPKVKYYVAFTIFLLSHLKSLIEIHEYQGSTLGGEDLVNNMAKWYLNPAILIYSEANDIYDALRINSFFLNYAD